MILFIYLCILVLNLVAIGLTYRFLGVAFEKKEKFIFITVGIAIMYMLVAATYWLSTKNMQFAGNAGMGTAQSLITFTFVPINMILTLPILASSYRAYKEGRLKAQNFKNRLIALAIILVIILIIEFFYFKDIQSGIIELINKANIVP